MGLSARMETKQFTSPAPDVLLALIELVDATEGIVGLDETQQAALQVARAAIYRAETKWLNQKIQHISPITT